MRREVTALEKRWRTRLAGVVPPRALPRLLRLRSRPDLPYSMAPFDSLGCVFVHIPKTAGVSISTALFGVNAGGHQTMAEYRWLYGKRELERRFTFTFVRNPWDRLYSAWRFLRGGGTEAADAAFNDRVLERFDGFDDFVCNGLHTPRVRRAVHFVPQARFLALRGRAVAVDFLGRFERLHDDFRLVADRLGVDASLEHLNASPIVPPSTPTEGTTAQPSYRSAYSCSARDAAKTFYADDIALFGYTF